MVAAVSSTQLPPGTLLLGKYRIQAFLGSGGFAQVYLAHHQWLQVPRALKIVSPRLTRLSSTYINRVIERFRLEARLGAHFADEPHLVRVYDFEEDPQQQIYILVMEYMPGGSLKQRLQGRSQGLPFPEVLRLAQDIARGLAALHRESLVHRDIKPANLLFNVQNRAKVADLGVVQMPDHTTRLEFPKAKPHPGTRAYMSPEQEHTTAPLSPASDIYSLGVVLFEALTLRNPKTLEPPVRLRDFRSDIPTWFDELLAEMLSPHPGMRPRDGSELLQRLEKPPKARHIVLTDDRTFDPAAEPREELEEGSSSANLFSPAFSNQDEGLPHSDQNAFARDVPELPLPSFPSHPEESFDDLLDENESALSASALVNTPPPSLGPPKLESLSSSLKTPSATRFVLTIQWSLPQALPGTTLDAWEEWLAVGTSRGILLLHLTSQEVQWLYDHPGGINFLRLTQPKHLLSGGEDGRILLWSLSTQKPVHAFTPAPVGQRYIALFRRSEKVFVSVDGQGRLYLWRTGQAEPVTHVPAGRGEPVGLVWQDDQNLVLAEGQGRLSRWRLKQNRFQLLAKWRYPTSWTSLTVQGKTALLGSRNGRIWKVDLETGEVQGQWQAHEPTVMGIYHLPDGLWLTIGAEGKLRLWSTEGVLLEEHRLPASPLSAAWTSRCVLGRGLWLSFAQGEVWFYRYELKPSTP